MYTITLEDNDFIRFETDERADVPKSLRFSFSENDIYFFENKSTGSNSGKYTDVRILGNMCYNVRLKDEFKNRGIKTGIFKECLPDVYRLINCVETK